MADYIGSARSNYILWDEEKLEALLDIFDLKVLGNDKVHGRKAIASTSGDGTPTADLWDLNIDDENCPYLQASICLGILPSWEQIRENKILGIELDPHWDHVELLDVVHKAFAKDPGSLFVWTFSGSEGDRYNVGGAIAMDSQGKILRRIDIDQIHDLPGVTSRAEY